MEVKFTINVRIDLAEHSAVVSCASEGAEPSVTATILAVAGLCDSMDLAEDDRRIAAAVIRGGPADDAHFTPEGGSSDG